MKKMYLPVSKVCTGAYAANDAKVRTKNYPFDWSGNSYKKTAYVIDNGFDGLFKNYEIAYNEERGRSEIWDADYEMFFIHETEDDISKIKKKYIKRYNNMITDLKNSDQVILIQSCQEEESLQSHWKSQQKYFKSKITIYKALDDDSLECIKESILKINPNIQIHITEHHEKWSEVVEELKFLK